MEEREYDEKRRELDFKLQHKQICEDEFNSAENKISGKSGINNKIKQIETDIADLQNQTINEKILSDAINRKISRYLSFELEPVDNGNMNGFYIVKDKNTGVIRKITEISTGEKNIIAFLYFLEKINEIRENYVYKPKIIVFDDPMNSNDDSMQYLIIEEVRKIIKSLSSEDKIVILTHNKHFYINIKHGYDINSKNVIKENAFFRLQSSNYKTKIILVNSEKDDFKTSYDSLWIELKYMYECENISSGMLLNPMRRILETFIKFNAISKNKFFDNIEDARKLFDVNSHSIDDFEAELNGKNKNEVLKIFYECFKDKGYEDHFHKHWKDCNSIH